MTIVTQVVVMIMVSIQEINLSSNDPKTDESWQAAAVYLGRMISQKSYTGCFINSKPPPCAVKLLRALSGEKKLFMHRYSMYKHISSPYSFYTAFFIHPLATQRCTEK